MSETCRPVYASDASTQAATRSDDADSVAERAENIISPQRYRHRERADAGSVQRSNTHRTLTMSDLITMTSPAPSMPNAPISARSGTLDDVPFMDGLQKNHSKQVGWMPTRTLEGKIALGHVLVAINEAGERVGYCIGNDRYSERDDVGIIYQMNVVPGRQRGLIGATLLKAQFERSAYGCRLRSRSGRDRRRRGQGSPRIHIFWQRRIRAGDTATPWWFLSHFLAWA
jgi:hypothetical protein